MTKFWADRLRLSLVKVRADIGAEVKDRGAGVFQLTLVHPTGEQEPWLIAKATRARLKALGVKQLIPKDDKALLALRDA